MGIDEQDEEREVLNSIFPEEITGISITLARILRLTLASAVVSETEYRVLVSLDMPAEDSEDSEPTTSLFLNVRYPEEYPDVEPIIDILTVPGVSRHKYLSVVDDRDQLMEGMKEVVQENLGMPMIFTLVSWVREMAEQIAAERKEAADKVQEDLALEAEREENKKFQGEPVTPESFTRWREAFRREMAEAKERAEEERLADMKKLKVKEEKKLTGKHLWESGMAGKGDEEGDDDDAPVDKMAKMQVAA
ncbi:Protein gir2 [Ceratocystis pirilliformis]|uniref:Protein gir2 n=1 Tax=Ceratocystis pirilliformis TaxID=259994 RepID=A0ABR3Z4R4_9PEZI